MTPQEARQELLDNLSRLSEKYPNLRVCQILGNAIPEPKSLEDPSPDIFYVEDERMLQWLLSFEEKEELNRRTTEETS